MTSRKSSILKPRKAREPLQDLNQLLPYNDDEETTTITGLTKRRVSFASINKVKEFESAAECVTLLNTPAYDERFSSISSDSCHSSVLSSSHTDPQKVITREASVREDLAAEEEIELTETVGGRIYESTLKSRVDSSMEYTVPYSSNLNQPERTVQYENVNQERTDNETSCMETTEVITNNMFSEALISHMCADTDFEERTVASECQNMEISPYREPLPASRKSIFHPDQNLPARKSIFDLPTPSPRLDFCDIEADAHLPANLTTNEPIFMDTSLLPAEEENEENSLSSPLNNRTARNGTCTSKRSIFSHPAPTPETQTIERRPSGMIKMSIRPEEIAVASSPVLNGTTLNNSAFHNSSVKQPIINQTKYSNSSMQIVSQEIEPKMESNVHPPKSPMPSERVGDSTLLAADQTKTRCSISDFQPSYPGEREIGHKTCYDNSTMQLVSQEVIAAVDHETVNKTRYNNSNMQLASQEGNDADRFGLFNQTDYDHTDALSVNRVENATNLRGITDKTRCNNSNMQLASQEGNEVDAYGISNQTGSDNTDMLLVNYEGNAINLLETNNRTVCNTSNLLWADKLDHEGSNIHLVVPEENAIDLGSDNSILKLIDPEDNLIDFCEISDKMRCNNSVMNLVDLRTNAAAESQDVTISIIESVNDGKEDIVATVQKDGANENENFTSPPVEPVACDGPLVDEVGSELRTLDVETGQLNPSEEDRWAVVDREDNANNKSKTEAQKSFLENSSNATSDSSPLTVDVNFSIFQKNKETRVEFSGTIDSNKRERSKSISNVQVNIINNKTRKEDHKVQKLRFSMPSTKTKFDETKPRVYASFVDTNVPSDKNEENHPSELNVLDDKSLEPVTLQSPVLPGESSVSRANVEQCSAEKRESAFAKKRLSSEMSGGTDDDHFGCVKRRSLSTSRNCETETETTTRNEKDSVSDEKSVKSDLQEVCTSIQVKERRQSIVYGNGTTFVAAENVIVETCSRVQTVTCVTSSDERTDTSIENGLARPAPSIDESVRRESSDALTFAATSDETRETRCPVEAGENFDGEIAAAAAVEVATPVQTCSKKSFVSANLSSFKSSLSDDVELSAKDRSVELRSDNDSERWPGAATSQVHSTPRRKRSIKSLLGNYSALEDELIDSLNNPSIIVNIDSFSHRSFDLGSESVSISETREGSAAASASASADSGAKMNCIETVPSNDVSKVNFVSDWLQNRTGKGDNKVLGLFENHSSSSSSKVIASEKNAALVSANSCKLPHEVLEIRTDGEEALPCEGDTDGRNNSCRAVEKDTSVNRLEDVEKVFEEADEAESAALVEINDSPPENELPELDAIDPAVDGIVVTDEALLPQNKAVPRTPEERARIDELYFVESVDQVRSDEREFSDRAGDRDEDVDLDLMDISSNEIDAEDENTRNADTEMKLHASLACETLKNEEAVEGVKEKVLEKIRDEYISHNSDWITKSVTCHEWIFQISEYRDLAQSLCLPRDVTVNIIPLLVVKIVPLSINCSASFSLTTDTLPKRYVEIMEIGIRALKQKCENKIKTICRTVEDLPCLLKSLFEDVDWMIKFTEDLRRIGGLEDVRYKNGKASFAVASYKNLILFHVCVDLSNLRTLSVKDVKVERQFGKMDTNCVLKIFSESGRDCDFFSKFVKKLTSTFDR